MRSFQPPSTSSEKKPAEGEAHIRSTNVREPYTNHVSRNIIEYVLWLLGVDVFCCCCCRVIVCSFTCVFFGGVCVCCNCYRSGSRVCVCVWDRNFRLFYLAESLWFLVISNGYKVNVKETVKTLILSWTCAGVGKIHVKRLTYLDNLATNCDHQYRSVVFRCPWCICVCVCVIGLYKFFYGSDGQDLLHYAKRMRGNVNDM